MILPKIGRYTALRMAGLLGLYTFVLSSAYTMAWFFRFDFKVPEDEYFQFFEGEFPVLLVKLLFLALFGQFSGLLSYFSIPDLSRLFYATTAGAVTLVVVRYLEPNLYGVPRGVILIDWVLTLGGLVSMRLGFRLLRERFWAPSSRSPRRARRVGIVGAGDVGASLARELMTKRGLGLHPVVFFDDDSTKWHSRIHDIPVVGAPESLMNEKLNLQLEQVIIAMPAAPAKRIGEVVKLLHKARLQFQTVPSMDQLATGKVKVSQLRSVEIADLLGREPVELEMENILQTLQGRVVMVTGAGGSIGSELCRQICGFHPKRVLLVDQSEVQMFQIEQELIEKGFAGTILPLVADVLDGPHIKHIFERFKPEVVFHAAAHKHVPMMESQPSEAIRNNTFGTAKLSEMALEFGVERFIFVSTDKAINPTNVMGASKRLAEIFIQALHSSPANRTKFIAVRFGNVLGSSGSVIPTFNKQIAAGGPVKVTHPEVTRYFMTIPEAAGLVLQSAAQGSGGEIFVLDMGSPVKIIDLARQLIELSGLKPDEDIEIQFVGLRPGEKLFEELSYKGENITPTNHPKIMRFVTEPLPLKHVRDILAEVERDLHKMEADQLKLLIKKAVPEYQPYLS